MNRRRIVLALAAALSSLSLLPSPAGAAERAVVMSPAELKWTPAGVPGVSIASVEGDMAKGPSHFYLKYDAGLSTPMHFHTPDHYVTTVSGTLVLVTGGKEHRLAPGSFFALTGKAVHAARVEGDQPCVMFIDARGPWDVVPSGEQPQGAR